MQSIIHFIKERIQLKEENSRKKEKKKEKGEKKGKKKRKKKRTKGKRKVKRGKGKKKSILKEEETLLYYCITVSRVWGRKFK